MSNPMECECAGWAIVNFSNHMLGNGHHENCVSFVANVGAMEMLRDLIKGIRLWAAEEDGVPDWLWDAYAKAVYVTEGKLLNDGRE